MNKCVMVAVCALFAGMSVFAQPIRYETDEFVFSNKVDVVDDFTARGNVTIGGETRTNWPDGGVGTTNASEINVELSPTSYSASTPDVEAHLVGLDAQLTNTTVWVSNTTGQAFLRRDGSLPMTGDFDAGGKDGKNFGTVTTTNFYLKGGSPTTGAVPVSVDNTGLVEWSDVNSFAVRILATGGTTNTTTLTVTGIPFRPKSVHVNTIALHTTMSSWGFVDVNGNQNCITKQSDSTWNTWSSHISILYSSLGGRHETQFSSWTTNGATFARAQVDSISTNNVYYHFIFYKQ
jgi:hypothetical protein